MHQHLIFCGFSTQSCEHLQNTTYTIHTPVLAWPGPQPPAIRLGAKSIGLAGARFAPAVKSCRAAWAPERLHGPLEYSLTCASAREASSEPRLQVCLSQVRRALPELNITFTAGLPFLHRAGAWSGTGPCPRDSGRRIFGANLYAYLMQCLLAAFCGFALSPQLLQATELVQLSRAATEPFSSHHQ